MDVAVHVTVRVTVHVTVHAAQNKATQTRQYSLATQAQTLVLEALSREGDNALATN